MSHEEILDLAKSLGSDGWCMDDDSLVVFATLIQGKAYGDGCRQGWRDCMDEYQIPRIGN
jgi:hypothetical protein